MASLQCRSLSVQHSPIPKLQGLSQPSPSSTSCNLRASVFMQGQRLQQSQQQHLSPRSSPSRQQQPLVIQCVSSTAGGNNNNNGDNEHTVISSSSSIIPEPIRAFPWAKAGNLFVKKLMDQLWIVGKWLAIPALAITVLGELVFNLLLESNLAIVVIPVGMICGIVFTGIMKETALELSPSIQDQQIPVHLVALGVLFVALKFLAPFLPDWGRASVPHFANGGLWQVVTLVREWRQRHPERKTVVEQN